VRPETPWWMGLASIRMTPVGRTGAVRVDRLGEKGQFERRNAFYPYDVELDL
jgi:hypothetical protein